MFHLTSPLILIVLSGQMGSGKSTIANHFSAKGFTHIRLGEFFKSQAREHQMDFVPYMEQLERTVGEEGKARILMEHVSKIAGKSQGVIIESAYSRPFIDSLRKSFAESNIFVVTTTSQKKIRVQRVAARNNVSRKEAFRLVSFWDAKRRQLGIDDVRKLSDLIVSNSRIQKNTVGRVVENRVRTRLHDRLVSVLRRTGKR
jgi:cytidylate kinase